MTSLRRLTIIFLQAILILTIVLGSIIPSFSQTTTFPGGSIDQLRALSPTLSFDHLIITGTLSLETYSSAIINVNDFTLTQSGSINSPNSSCDYGPEADIKINATGRVEIRGSISLTGRYGTRVTSTASCKSCYGADGGDVQIVANEILITGDIMNYGGGGGTSVSSYGSSGCSGGDGGKIHLEARNIELHEAEIKTYGGTGGYGCSYGDCRYGSTGAHPPLNLLAVNRLKMNGNYVTTSGPVTLKAEVTDIFGPINGSTINENIDGQADHEAPEVTILSPATGTVLDPNNTVQVQIEVSDRLTGVNRIVVEGLGYSQEHSGARVIDGVLTVGIPAPKPPLSLRADVYDNKGHMATDAIDQLGFIGDLTVDAGTDYVLGENLVLGDAATLIVNGNLIIERGSHPTITVGQFQVGPTGQVKAETATGTNPEAIPSLTVNVDGNAVIDGTVNLNGRSGYCTSSVWGTGGRNGEKAGHFDLSADDITIAGDVLARGGQGSSCGLFTRHFGGGQGGTVDLNTRGTLAVTGTVSVKGGEESAYPGKGGTIRAVYMTAADVAARACEIAGGSDAWEKSGALKFKYTGPRNPSEIPDIAESEPNDGVSSAQWLLPPVRVNSDIEPGDGGEIEYTGSTNDIEDVYMMYPEKPVVVDIKLSAADASQAVWAKIYDYSAGSLEGAIWIGSASSSYGLPLSVTDLQLEAKPYLLLVDMDETETQTTYHLEITPQNAMDEDVDNLEDWWEWQYFKTFARGGAGDYDSDGLTDQKEHDLGTDPTSSDTDRDRMPDHWEVQAGTDPLKNDAAADNDRDGLSNLDEYQIGIDPNNPDTDYDRIPDDWEVGHGSDPKVYDSHQDLDGNGRKDLIDYNFASGRAAATISSIMSLLEMD